MRLLSTIIAILSLFSTTQSFTPPSIIATTSTPYRNFGTIPQSFDSTLINHNRFRTTAAVIGGTRGTAVTSAADRDNLTARERITFIAKATEGISGKFSTKQDLAAIIDPSKSISSDFFTKSLDFNLLVQELKEKIEDHVLDTVFYILNIEEVFNPVINARRLVKRTDRTIYLLDNYTSIDLNAVLLSVEYYATFSDENIDSENLQWSKKLILNSCDDELQHYLKSRLCLLPSIQHSGPTIFMIMVDQIISNNEHLSRSLISHLNSFQVTSIPGENIEQVAAFITTVCQRLDSCQKLPPDVARIVFDIMLTCTVDRFKHHFHTLESSESPKLLTYQSVLREAVRFYTTLYTGINQWLPATAKGSIYVTNASTTLPRNTTSDSTTKRTHDYKGNLIDRNGSKPGEPISRDSKVNPGRKEYWCSKCDRWVSHDDAHHDAWKRRSKDFYNRNKSGANVAESLMQLLLLLPWLLFLRRSSLLLPPQLLLLVLATSLWLNA